jgi:hypothetical protein
MAEQTTSHGPGQLLAAKLLAFIERLAQNLRGKGVRGLADTA